MNRQKTFTILAALALVFAFVPDAFHVLASPPSNDEFEQAAEVSKLPFAQKMDISQATYAADDPLPSCFPLEKGSHPEASVWYVFTLGEDTLVRASMDFGSYQAILGVYTGAREALSEVACGLLDVSFVVQANLTYYLMVGAVPEGGLYPAPPGTDNRRLFLTINSTPPPVAPNDDFDSAVVLPSLPFEDTLDTSEATPAIDDPQDCAGTYHSVWFALTPAADMKILAETGNSVYATTLAVFTGSRGHLSLVSGGCSDVINRYVLIDVQAGATYYFMVTDRWGSTGSAGGILVLSVKEAAVLSNDNLAGAEVIAALPFEEEVDTRLATVEDGEPQPSCYPNTPLVMSIWFRFSAKESGTVRGITVGEGSYVQAIYTGDSLGSLIEQGCSFSPMTLSLEAGQQYSIQIGEVGRKTGPVRYYLAWVLPPPNDDFARAIVVSGPPHQDIQDLTLATDETGEPFPSCARDRSPGETIWYAYTPDHSGRVRVLHASGAYPSFLGVYAGSSLGGLAEVGCSAYSYELTLLLEQGQTYYFQVGSWRGYPVSVAFKLEVARPPSVDFFFYPDRPSIYNTVEFQTIFLEPGDSGSCQWDFGDGSKQEGCDVSHRFAADGDYLVTLTVTTADGSTNSVIKKVQVRTRDVVVMRLLVPPKPEKGKTYPIRVGVLNLYQAETVEVELYKSTPKGFEFVGRLIKEVPHSSRNKTTSFKFTYTFTQEDTLMGKVSFQAIATIQEELDALPCDNELISLPVKLIK